MSVSTASPTPNDRPAHLLRRLQEPPRAAVIGAGPLGLEAALYAARLGHSVLVFEGGEEIAAEVRLWGHVTMFTPWRDNRSPLGELAIREAVQAKALPDEKLPAGGVYPTGENFVRQYLNRLARLLGDAVHRDTRVVALGRSFLFPEEHQAQPEKRSARRFRLLTRSPREEKIWTADYVLDATGLTQTPNWAGAGGLPALGEMGSFRQFFHHIPDVLGRDRAQFLGKRTLLIGDGDSAATTAVGLSEVLALEPHGSALWVTPSRAEMPMALTPDDPLPLRDTLLKKANLLVQNKPAGFEYSPVTQVEAIQHSLATGKFQVTLQVNHQTQRMAFDTVVANVGYRRDVSSFQRALHPDEPGLYAVGGRASASGDWLLPQGREQIRDSFRRITGRPELDLYAEARAGLGGDADAEPE